MFAFGKNWDSFSQLISEDRIRLAEDGLRRLFPNDELRDKPFFDIGCGSGLSMVAALRLGASEAHGIDIDENSVSTAQRTLEQFSGGRPFSVKHQSVFDLSPERDGRLPIVYSWGVLHHTGEMWKAIETAASMVEVGGKLAIALYRSTPLCVPWQLEKRVYSSAPVAIQFAMRSAYKAAYLSRVAATGRNPLTYIKDYSGRGMSWHHDVHDWLGGYPYESAPPDEVVSYLNAMGMRAEMVGADAKSHGIFGAGCNEYVATRIK